MNEGFKKLSEAVREWYESGCPRPDLLENVFIGIPSMDYIARPRYEQL